MSGVGAGHKWWVGEPASAPSPRGSFHLVWSRDRRGWFKTGCTCVLDRLHAMGARGAEPEQGEREEAA